MTDNHPNTFEERAAARFVKKVTKTDTCWLWAGYTMRNGYGVITIDKRTYTAHRLMYEITFGPVPPEMFVCHTCDVRNCVRPDHLFLGTAQDNTNDMVRKSRHLPPPTGAMVPCDHCSKEIYRKLRDLKSHAKAFCSQQCHSAYMKAHPEWKPILNKSQQRKLRQR